MVPFLAVFSCPLCLPETPLLLPKPGSCSGCSTEPNQILRLSSHALCLSPAQEPTDPAPTCIPRGRSTHGDGTRVLQAFVWTRPGSPRAPAGAATLHLPVTAVLSHHLFRAPHPSSFNTFLGRLPINRKQLPGWDSPLPPSREIILLGRFIQADSNDSKQANTWSHLLH